MSVKSQAAKGMMWNAIERFSSQGIQFVLTILIARILSPNDYGLIAMLGIFMAIAQSLIDSGLSSALIQKANRTEVDYSTMFYFNMAISVFIYLLLFISAPLIAQFYNQPALVKIARVFGICFITNSLGVIQMTRLTIALNFKKQALAALISVVVSGSVGIWMAYQGFGVWTLVFQTILANFTWAVMLWFSTRWVPKWCFSWHSFRSLFSFGSKMLLSGLLHTLYTNMYSLVVGKCFNASTLGYFNRAYTLGQFPVQNFSNIVQKVLYPILCRYQDDEKKFFLIFENYLRISCFILFPLMIGFAVLAKPLVLIILTEKWLSMVPLLQIICLAQMWDPIMKTNVSVLSSRGRSDYQLFAEIIKKIIAFTILFVSIPFGIEAVCWGLVLYAFSDIMVVIWYSRKLMSCSYWWQFKKIFPIALLAFAMGGIVWIVSSFFTSHWLQLLSGFTVGFIFYTMTAFLLKFSEIQILLLFLKNKGKGIDIIKT